MWFTCFTTQADLLQKSYHPINKIMCDDAQAPVVEDQYPTGTPDDPIARMAKEITDKMIIDDGGVCRHVPDGQLGVVLCDYVIGDYGRSEIDHGNPFGEAMRKIMKDKVYPEVLNILRNAVNAYETQDGDGSEHLRELSIEKLRKMMHTPDEDVEKESLIASYLEMYGKYVPVLVREPRQKKKRGRDDDVNEVKVEAGAGAGVKRRRSGGSEE